MSYLDEVRLSTYNSSLKEWVSSQESKTITSNIYPWTKTAKASAVSCYPVGGTELKPVVDFMFIETPPVEGDKEPDNPSTISGVSSVTVTHCETTGVDSTDYTINLNGTYYGGSLDIATGLMTVTWVRIDVDVIKSNSISASLDYIGNTCAGVSINPEKLGGGVKVREYKSAYANTVNITNAYSYTVDEECVYTTTGSSYITVKLNKSRLSNETDFTDIVSIKNAFLEWFANNPTYIVYKLRTPITVQLNPVSISALAQVDKYTPRLNTVYTDASSVQVGYVKSSIREEYELTQAIVAQGGNI